MAEAPRPYDNAEAALVSLSKISKSFLLRRVLAVPAFSLGEAESVLVLGANGSGKSTLLRLMAGLLRPDDGARSVRPDANLGYFGHRLLLYPQLTVKENLSFFASLQEKPATLSGAMEEWQLSPLAERPVRHLSKGQQSRVALARAFLGDPDVLLLDEPTTSLDHPTIALLVSMLLARAARAPRASTVLVTHDPEAFESWATRVLILEGGKIASDTGADRAAVTEAIRQYSATRRTAA